MNKQNNIPQKNKRTWIYLIGGGLFLPAVLCFVGYFGFIQPLKSYISSSPWPIAHLQVSRNSQEMVIIRIKDFTNSKRSGDSLVLSSQDINHLIHSNSLIHNYGVKYLVELEDSLFNIKSNADVKKVMTHLRLIIRLMGLKGYINTEIEGYIRFRENKLNIITTRSQMGGQQAPFTLLGKRTHIDIGDFFQDKTRYESFKNSIKSVSISRKKLIFIRK